MADGPTALPQRYRPQQAAGPPIVLEGEHQFSPWRVIDRDKVGPARIVADRVSQEAAEAIAHARQADHEEATWRREQARRTEFARRAAMTPAERQSEDDRRALMRLDGETIPRARADFLAALENLAGLYEGGAHHARQLIEGYQRPDRLIPAAPTQVLAAMMLGVHNFNSNVPVDTLALACAELLAAETQAADLGRRIGLDPTP